MARIPRCIVMVMLGGLVAACGGGPAPAPPAPEPPALPERLQPKAAACEAGDADACDAVARHFGGGVKARICTRSSAVATRTCGSTDEARPLMVDDARRARRKEWNARAAALYGERCTAGDADACVATGRLVAAVEDGRYTAEPRGWFDRALALWDTACAAGDAEACLALRRAWREGIIVDRDRAQAAQAELRACGAGHDTSCRGLLRPFQSTQRLYTPTERKGPLPSAFGGSISPTVVAAFGTPPNASPYQKACRNGEGLACVEAGKILAFTDATAAERADRRARRLLDRPCKRGDGDACLGLSRVYAHGSPVPRDAERAERLRVKACEAGSGEACARRGSDLAVDADEAQRVVAVEALRAACAADSARGCAMAGIVLLSGRDVPIDRAAGCAHLEKACAGNRRACRIARDLCPRAPDAER